MIHSRKLIRGKRLTKSALFSLWLRFREAISRQKPLDIASYDYLDWDLANRHNKVNSCRVDGLPIRTAK